MKNNKKNKKSNEQAKNNALLLGKSLINNEAVVVGARRKGWWWALIMLVFSGMVAAIPATVKASKNNGADFISGTNVSGYDVSFRKMAEEFKEKGIEFTVHHEGKNGKESYIEASAAVESSADVNLIYQHYNYDDKLDFEAYYVPGEFTSAKLSSIISNVPTYDGSGSLTYTSRTSSFVAFGKDVVVSYLYMTGSSSSSNTVAGNYYSFADGYKLTSILDIKDKDGNLLDKNNANDYSAYTDGVWTNTKAFFTTSYKSTVATMTWQTGLIVLGINYAVTLFMGLMIFILTRGKANPFRIYTFWESQKIAYWSTISPAVLALAVGFLVSNFAQVAFAMLVGIRVMWMAMKTLKPDNQSEVLFEDVKKDKIVNAK